MSGLEPFTPDDDYCVYCHAPAAGLCAGCGALCCADCVELVMGWTQQRAVCSSCLERVPPRPDASRALWVAAGLALAVVALAWLL